MRLDAACTGRFIQSCRRDMGLTQSELSERLGVSPQAVSNWERGEALPDISVLPELACVLRCSVDALLSGGAGCGGFRRHVTVAQMREALSALGRIGELLGRDHFIFDCMIRALDVRMNTEIEAAFSDAHIFDVFVGEFLLGCVRAGDYVDPRDVQAHMQPGRPRDYVLNALREAGIR